MNTQKLIEKWHHDGLINDAQRETMLTDCGLARKDVASSRLTATVSTLGALLL